MTAGTCVIEKENKDSFKVKTGNVQGMNIVGTVLLSFANPHCLQVRQCNRVSCGIWNFNSNCMPLDLLYLRRNYTDLAVNHITCPISSFTLILHWKVKNLMSLALNPMTTPR